MSLAFAAVLRPRRAPRLRRAVRGFTLIEVLMATSLLAAGLALAFVTLRASGAAATRGEEVAARNERMRAVEGFLRRRLASAQAISYAIDERQGLPQRFFGERDKLRFVADLPPYLGRGGPHLHEIEVVREPNGEGFRLQVGFSVVLGNQVVEEPRPRPPELLAGGLREVRFRYRSLNAEGRTGEWQDRWENADRMPLQVAIDIVDERGQPWPPMIVSLPLAASFAGVPAPVP